MQGKRYSLSVLFVTTLLAAEDKPNARFHHVHINSTDPASSVEFYSTKFNARKEKFLGKLDGVWARNTWILFRRVSEPPPAEPVSAIWRIGWGAANDALVQGPDKELIELNTAPRHDFSHVHLFSADPIAAGKWYEKHFGARDTDDVNVVIDRWKSRTALLSTKGRVIDHIGFSVDNLDEAVKRWRAGGVTILEEPRTALDGALKLAFIEGPDAIRIEVVEGHAETQRVK